eukprot:1022651_1
MAESVIQRGSCQYIIPQFETIEQSYSPWIRHDHWTYYEIIKTILMIPVALIRVCAVICTVVIGWIILKLSFYQLDEKTNRSTQQIPVWRALLRRAYRYCPRLLMFCCGIYNITTTKLTYKDLYRLYGYKRPDLDIDDPLYNTPPPSHVIVSNHLGYLDISLFKSYHYNGSFLCKEAMRQVTCIGEMAKIVNSLFLVKGKQLSKEISDHVCMMHEAHDHGRCKGCYLCVSSSALVIFPEGTTTNNKVKMESTHFSTTWETISFRDSLFRTCTQLVNYMKVIEAPPYVPSKEEIEDPYLYSFNVNQLMSKMLG